VSAVICSITRNHAGKRIGIPRLTGDDDIGALYQVWVDVGDLPSRDVPIDVFKSDKILRQT